MNESGCFFDKDEHDRWMIIGDHNPAGGYERKYVAYDPNIRGKALKEFKTVLKSVKIQTVEIITCYHRIATGSKNSVKFKRRQWEYKLDSTYFTKNLSRWEEIHEHVRRYPRCFTL